MYSGIWKRILELRPSWVMCNSSVANQINSVLFVHTPTKTIKHCNTSQTTMWYTDMITVIVKIREHDLNGECSRICKNRINVINVMLIALNSMGASNFYYSGCSTHLPLDKMLSASTEHLKIRRRQICTVWQLLINELRSGTPLDCNISMLHCDFHCSITALKLQIL